MTVYDVSPFQFYAEWIPYLSGLYNLPLRDNVYQSLEPVRRGRRTLRYNVIIECILRKLLLPGVKFVWKRKIS